ncbi:MAG: M23 family metallopeptidase [Lachnospiraceae bacterium]|nr:M23 family metallopeptidase [Lachnospiraceae bacterium]
MQRQAVKESAVSEEAEGDYIKWVDFNVTVDALDAAYQCGLDAHENGIEVDWIELLAWAACRNGGEFGKNDPARIKEQYAGIKDGETSIGELTKELTYYSYYLEAYTAVLGGYMGEYQVRAASEADTEPQEDAGAVEADEEEDAGTGEEEEWETRYGLKVFSPIAKGFPYSDYDDFGASRSYGYKRVHLGHDMTGQIGTPIICVESGYVEAIGWNQYGGWRIGIRSFDKKRYYYYAHLLQNYPYAEGLEEGSIVTAGDVIGYLGHTGYSTTENVNNIEVPHLHFGIQLIFDESQKEGNNEIWIDCYQIVQFLRKNQSKAQKVEGTKEWKRVEEWRDPNAENNST